MRLCFGMWYFRRNHSDQGARGVLPNIRITAQTIWPVTSFFSRDQLMFDQCPNEKVGIIYYLLLDYPRQMNVIVGKYGNYEPGIVSECRGRCKNAPSCSVNLLWVCLKISMLGIGVCKRKYADTPLRRSLCLRRKKHDISWYISVQFMFNWCSSSTTVLGPCLDPVWRWSAQAHQPCQKLIPLHPEKKGKPC